MSRESSVDSNSLTSNHVHFSPFSMELTSDSMEIKPTVTRKLRRRPNEPLPVVEKRRKPTNGQLVLQLDDKDVENDLKSINRAKGVMTVMRPNSNPSSSSSGGGGMGNGALLGGGPGGYSVTSSPGGIMVGLPMNSSGTTVPGVMSSPSASSHGTPATSSVCPMSPRDPDQSSSIETKIEDGKLLYERRWFHRGQPVFVEGKDLPRFPGIISAINDVVWVKKLTDGGSKIKINTNQLSRGKISIKRRAS